MSQKDSKAKNWKISAITKKIPSYRNSLFISNEGWLKGKQKEDEAEGLWRIHDSLYDFTDFVNHHPGGSFWLQQTKGTDITEAFESHHISLSPEKMLQKFKIRNAEKPRNYKFTLKEEGFYKTLKSRVRERLKELNYKPSRKTNMMHLALLVGTLGFAILSCYLNSKIVAAVAALCLCWLTTAAHNFFHQKDNWQMYTFNFSLLNYTNWRVSHALSHHVYPNSLLDLEMSFFEPFLCWVPNPYIASKLQRLVSVLVQPIVYALIFPFQFIIRTMYSLIKENLMHWHDVIPFSLPLLMFLISGTPLSFVLKQWCFIITVASFFFGIVGLNASHHGPEIYHDGDAFRNDYDWGLYQCDTTIDRCDISGSDFLVLTHFGEHTLHHLFPTIDHSFLPNLYPPFITTLKEFEVDFKAINGIEHIIGQNKQLLRTKPNPRAPGSKKFN